MPDNANNLLVEKSARTTGPALTNTSSTSCSRIKTEYGDGPQGPIAMRNRFSGREESRGALYSLGMRVFARIKSRIQNPTPVQASRVGGGRPCNVRTHLALDSCFCSIFSSFSRPNSVGWYSYKVKAAGAALRWGEPHTATPTSDTQTSTSVTEHRLEAAGAHLPYAQACIHSLLPNSNMSRY